VLPAGKKYVTDTRPAQWGRREDAFVRMFISCLFLFGGKARVNRPRRIGMDLHDRAMVVSEISVLVQSVICHKLNNLQNAAFAVNVRDFDVGFLLLVELRAMLEQAVGEDGRKRRVLYRSRDGSRAVCGRFGSSFRILRKFVS